MSAATREDLPLGAAARVFARQTSPRIIAPALGVSVAARIVLGRWRPMDLVVAAVILGLQPFTEWFTHVLLLHAKPRKVFGRTVDLLVARKHREHHADPKDLELVLIPHRVLVVAMAAGAVGYLAGLPTIRLGLTAMAVSYAMLLIYEWTHYLIHTPYRPRSRYYRSIWRAHRLHHFRNERYWFGVTINLADHVLRTFPAKDAVPLSPTAKTLDAGLGNPASLL